VGWGGVGLQRRTGMWTIPSHGGSGRQQSVFICVVHSKVYGELLLLSYSSNVNGQLMVLSEMYRSKMRLISSYMFSDMMVAYRSIREYMNEHGADLDDRDDPKLLEVGPRLFEEAVLRCV